jgi:hypothetical protein
MIDQLTRHDFAQLSPGSIGVDYQGVRLNFSVVETRDLPPVSPRAAPFAVVLAGPASPLLPQGIYPLEHPIRGLLELFMVPIGRDSSGTRYEMVFN